MVRRNDYIIDPGKHPDGPLREHMEILRDLIADNPFVRFRGVLIEKEYTAAATNDQVSHGLGWVPQDALVIYVSNGATVTINYDNFTSEFIDITVSAACTVRSVVGTLEEQL